MSDIFVNLPVKNLPASKEFYAKLGYTFNPQFTDDNAACMIIDEHIYAMLITEPYFKTFTPREIADTTKVVEVLNALSTDSREKVDWYAKTAVEAGGKIHRDSSDHGWMYSQSIEDIDGHVWEYVWMDPNNIQATE